MAVFRVILPNDLELVSNRAGKKALVFTTDTQYIRQKLKHRLLFMLGEFFGDVRQGMPYRERMLVSSPDLDLIKSLFWTAIEDSPGIQRVQSVDILFDKSNRSLGVSFVAQMSNGEALAIDSRRDSDFIIDLSQF
jgi:hypothetical protein